MKKRFKRKNSLVVPQDSPGVAGLINKVQQQLSAVEKKLDILIGQSSKGPLEKSYSQKPPGNFHHANRHDNKGRQGNDLREKTYTRVICADCNTECEIPFKPSGDRPVYCKECFPKHRKGFSREYRSDKSQAGNRQTPFKTKKPFYANRKRVAKAQ